MSDETDSIDEWLANGGDGPDYDEDDAFTNAERYELMLELRESGATYQEIADTWGITRQRAHQILHGYKSKGRREGGKPPVVHIMELS